MSGPNWRHSGITDAADADFSDSADTDTCAVADGIHPAADREAATAEGLQPTNDVQTTDGS